MATRKEPDTDEVARPPKSRRQQVEEMPHEKLAFFRVTETQEQRDRGTSIVNHLTGARKGWIKPEDAALLDQRGNSFNLVMPKEELERKRAANNRRAKLSEGFSEDKMPGGVSIKEQTKEETTFKGSDIIPEDHNG